MQDEQGIRKGYPISRILYFFVAEIVSNKINNNDSIKGLTDRNFENKIQNHSTCR